MGFLDLINHVFNFLAPALFVGVLMAAIAPYLYKKKLIAHVFIAQAAINCVAGSLALGVGLWFFGRDAKMASYGAMLVCATLSQSWALRGR